MQEWTFSMMRVKGQLYSNSHYVQLKNYSSRSLVCYLDRLECNNLLWNDPRTTKRRTTDQQRAFLNASKKEYSQKPKARHWSIKLMIKGQHVWIIDTYSVVRAVYAALAFRTEEPTKKCPNLISRLSSIKPLIASCSSCFPSICHTHAVSSSLMSSLSEKCS